MNELFDADIFAEWFINGELTQDKITGMSDSHILAVGENLLQRFSEKDQLDWFGFVLKF